ncbi:MAG: hypothetical protein ACLRQF_13130 [Thomasclavelia ramosa]
MNGQGKYILLILYQRNITMMMSQPSKLAGTGVSNISFIGIDEGATFVNNYISQNCYFIAGMMVYGGTMNSDLTYNVPIPAYLSSTATSAVSYYKQANQTDQSQSFNNYTIYQNSTNPLQIVVNSKTDETLKNAFDNAWETVFSKTIVSIMKQPSSIICLLLIQI